jgi:hypothetical protein
MTCLEPDAQRKQDVTARVVNQQDSEEPEVSVFEVIYKFNNLFVCLFKAAVGITDYIAWNERMIMNNELGRTWKENMVP